MSIKHETFVYASPTLWFDHNKPAIASVYKNNCCPFFLQFYSQIGIVKVYSGQTVPLFASLIALVWRLYFRRNSIAALRTEAYISVKVTSFPPTPTEACSNEDCFHQTELFCWSPWRVGGCFVMYCSTQSVYCALYIIQYTVHTMYILLSIM